MQLKVDQICQNERIEVGRLGENDANRIAFDFTAWVESYGAGNITLLFQRPTEELIYPITLSVDGTTATWTVSETDTAISGKAHATLIYTVDEVVKKSAEFFCMIEKVLSANGQTPEPYEDYLAQIVAAGAAAEEAAGIAEDAKEAIENMTASATGLPAGAAPTVDKTTIGGVVNLDFGIPKGEKGERGEQGPRGIQGATGAAATVDVFGTETIDPNEDARVENIGDTNHALLVFRIPRGATGAQGAQGAQGEQGARGSLWYVGLAPTLDLPQPPQDGDVYLCNGRDVSYPAGSVYTFVNGAWSHDPDGSIRGAQGDPGVTGAQGERGSWWYVGDNPISAILPDAKDGDLYLQDYNGQVWQMEEGFWFEKGSIRGPKGEDGVGIPSGGTDGQIIRKDTSAQGGAVWQNVDAAPTENSTNLVESGGVAAALAGKTGIDLGIVNASVGEVATVSAVDENGKPTAWSALKTGEWEELLSVTLEEDTSNISYIEETGNFNKRYKQLAIFVQLVGTVTIYPKIGFCNNSGNIEEGWSHHFYNCQNENYGAIKSSASNKHAFLIDVLSTATSTPVITRKINGAFGNQTYPSSIFGTCATCISNETVAGLTYGFAIIAAATQSAFPAGSKIKMYGVKR